MQVIRIAEADFPPLLAIKELSAVELAERERNLRKLRQELRSEEMKLVLLKKLKQSQQLKENIAAVPKVPPKLPPPISVQSPSHRYSGHLHFTFLKAQIIPRTNKEKETRIGNQVCRKEKIMCREK